jgi:hypothetical protein
MATGINIDPSISLGIKPPAAMSLSDMLNIARGAQLYQTERQLQPEQIRQMQLKTQLETATTPEQIQQSKLQTQFAGSQAQTAKVGTEAATENLSKSRADRAFNIVGGFMNDPRISSGDPQQTVAAMLDAKKKAIATGVPELQVEAIFAPMMSTAAHDAKSLPQMISNIIQSQLGAQGQQALQTGEVVTVGEQPGVYRPATRTIEPITFGAAPQVGQTPPAQPAAQPPVGVTGADMTAPIKSDRPALIYPVPQAGVPRPILPQEQFDQESGSKFRNGLVQQQSQLPTARRNLQEVTRTADKLLKESILPETGAIGAAKRGIANFIGDPTYKQLSKDLANVQISNIQAMGGSMDTVSGQNLMKMASGDETFPPEVLLSIARRADADLTQMDLMANGLQKHSQRYGDANTKRYQQMWAANADSRIFEMMNIARDVKDPNQRQALTDKLLGGMDQTQREQLVQKYQNLLKLTKTGDL